MLGLVITSLSVIVFIVALVIVYDRYSKEVGRQKITGSFERIFVDPEFGQLIILDDGRQYRVLSGAKKILPLLKPLMRVELDVCYNDTAVDSIQILEEPSVR